MAEPLSQALAGWCEGRSDPGLVVRILEHLELPARDAGVGLARKLGMDEAVARLAAARRPRGIIVGLDADCRVDADYLTALHEHFRRHPDSPGCSVYFEHPLPGASAPVLHAAITRRNKQAEPAEKKVERPVVPVEATNPNANQGLADEPEPPGIEDAPDLSEPQLQDTLDALTAAAMNDMILADHLKPV